MATTQHAGPDPLRVDAGESRTAIPLPERSRRLGARSNHVCCRDCRRSTYPRAVYALLWDAKAQQWLQCRYVDIEYRIVERVPDR